MERTVLTFSVANIVTVNLMVFMLVFLFLAVSRAFRGRADA